MKVCLMNIKILLFLLFSISLFAKEINIAVAANASYAIDEIIKLYKKNHNIDIKTTVGSSGKLATQILHNAPYDIFLSANMDYPNKLYKSGKASAPKVYAKGLLALFTTRDDVNISRGLKVLLDNKIKKISIANDKTAPYGKATKEVLIKAGLYDKLMDKFIYSESIGGALMYTLRAADIGFVAKSTLLSKKLSQYKEGKNWIEVDKNLYSPILQGAVLVNRSSKDARDFYNFLFSKEAKEIFKSFGYEVK